MFDDLKLSTGHFQNQYENLGELGSGSYGVVYEAKHRTDQTVFAVKMLQIDTDEHFEESQREVRFLETMKHESIVPYKDSWLEQVDKNDGNKKSSTSNVFIVMGLGSGTLETWLEKHRNEQSRTSTQRDLWIKQLVEGVSYIHKNRIMHRDLKPANILLFPASAGFSLKISDFGLAKNTGDENGEVGEHSGGVGTMQYTAPELNGFGPKSYSRAVDLYSLGLILMEILFSMNEGQTNSLCTSRWKGELPTVFMKSDDKPDKKPKIIGPRAVILFGLTDHDPAKRLESMNALSELLLNRNNVLQVFFEVIYKDHMGPFLDVTNGRVYLIKKCFSETCPFHLEEIGSFEIVPRREGTSQETEDDLN